MNEKTEQTTEPEVEQATEPKAEPKAEQATEHEAMKDELHGELESWQTKLDEAKLQMHLGAKEVEQNIQPYVDQLEQEMAQAQAQWEKFEGASEDAWDDIQSGVSKSMKSMQMAFDKAKSHFPDEKKK